MIHPVMLAGEPDADPSAEITRLHKIIAALIVRAEQANSRQRSDFGLFQSTVLLEERVRARTAELEAVLRENARIARALRQSEERNRTLVSQSLAGIAVVENGRITYVNPKFEQIFGYPAEELLLHDYLMLVSDAHKSIVVEEESKRLGNERSESQYIFRGRRKDGREIDLECHNTCFYLDGKRATMCLLIDVTERMRAERELLELQAQLRAQATHDPLTNLHNRHFLDEAFERELARARIGGYPVAIIMADLDRFKRVNDTYGHLGGDVVLRAFSSLIRRLTRRGDVCCRYGGEEFLLVLPGLGGQQAYERAEKLRQSLAATPIQLKGTPTCVTASFGLALFPEDAATAEDLIQVADQALYRAKENGRNRTERGRG